MAIINPSALLSEIRGNVGNVSFARNKSGPFVRAKINQVNRDTIFQQGVRDAMAQAVIDWQNADMETYLDYTQFCNEHPKSGRLSRKFTLSAYNEFVSRQINRYLLNEMPVYVPAFPPVRVHPWIHGVTTDEEELNVTINALDSHVDNMIAIYASAPMSPGIHSINPAWCRFIVPVPMSGNTLTENIWTEYSTRIAYTGNPNGKKVFIAVKAINADNYASGTMQFGTGIINAWPVIADTFDSTFDETFS